MACFLNFHCNKKKCIQQQSCLYFNKHMITSVCVIKLGTTQRGDTVFILDVYTYAGRGHLFIRRSGHLFIRRSGHLFIRRSGT